jgi:hypothetical protein
MKVKPSITGNPNDKRYTFECPGCGHHHQIWTVPLEPGGPSWGFNEKLDQPTFTPSLLVRCGHYVPGQKQPPNCDYCNEGCDSCFVCHSFITDGKIQFLSDCTHKLAGQTVELPDIESE